MEIYKPARAVGSVCPDALYDFVRGKRNLVYEHKLDGSRYVLYIENGVGKLLSRRRSVVTGEFVDKTENCPHLMVRCPKDLEIVFDGEIVSGFTSSDVTRIMGSSPARALKLQREEGYVRYHVFDCLCYNGSDLTKTSWEDRQNMLGCVWATYNFYHTFPYLHRVSCEAVRAFEIERVFNTIIADGGEGLMLKDKNALYGTGWWKVKKEITFDVIITGFTEGKNKYKELIGSIKFSLYKDGDLIEVGQCSGMDDAIRYNISINRDSYLNRVMEVKGQEFTGKRIRHPRFVRFRLDKNMTDCVWEHQIENIISRSLIKERA